MAGTGAPHSTIFATLAFITATFAIAMNFGRSSRTSSAARSELRWFTRTSVVVNCWWRSKPLRRFQGALRPTVQLSTVMTMSRSDTVFDVMIIGGGPAGAGAGLRCARHGLSVVILDKDDYP